MKKIYGLYFIFFCWKSFGDFSNLSISNLNRLKDEAQFEIDVLTNPQEVIRLYRQKIINLSYNGVPPSSIEKIKISFEKYSKLNATTNHLWRNSYLTNHCLEFFGLLARLNFQMQIYLRKYLFVKNSPNSQLATELLINQIMKLHMLLNLKAEGGIGNIFGGHISCKISGVKPIRWYKMQSKKAHLLNQLYLAAFGQRSLKSSTQMTQKISIQASHEKIYYYSNLGLKIAADFIGYGKILGVLKLARAANDISQVTQYLLAHSLIWIPISPLLWSSQQYFENQFFADNLKKIQINETLWKHTLDMGQEIANINFETWSIELIPLAQTFENQIFQHLKSLITNPDNSLEMKQFIIKMKHIENKSKNYENRQHRIDVILGHINQIQDLLKRKKEISSH